MSTAHRIALLSCAALLSPSAATATAAATATPTATAATVASAPAHLMPPPGLYRIDMDTSIKTTLAGISGLARLQTDGASGTERSSGKVQGGVWKQGAVAKGGGPVTECVKPVTAAKPMASSAGAGCVAKGGTLKAGAWVIHQQCGPDEYEITMRKINNSTWEYKTVVMQKAVGSAATANSSQSGMLAMLSIGRDHAPNDKERKEYEAQMAGYKSAMKEEAAKGGGGQGGSSQGQAMTRNTVAVQKWTRIAEKCDGGTK